MAPEILSHLQPGHTPFQPRMQTVHTDVGRRQEARYEEREPARVVVVMVSKQQMDGTPEIRVPAALHHLHAQAAYPGACVNDHASLVVTDLNARRVPTYEVLVPLRQILDKGGDLILVGQILTVRLTEYVLHLGLILLRHYRRRDGSPHAP